MATYEHLILLKGGQWVVYREISRDGRLVSAQDAADWLFRNRHELTESFYGREDLALSDKLMAERSGILLWAIEGWRRLRERGRFQPPVSSTELREQMEDLASPVGAFLRERCLIGPEYRATVDGIYAQWMSWCEASNREPGNTQTFCRDLIAACPSLRKVRPRDGEDRYRAYEGIGIRCQPAFQGGFRS